MSKNKGGRPLKIDKNILSKLEDAFVYDYTDEEACLYAGISPATLYRYQEKNKRFRERKEALKLTPNLKTKKTIVDSLGDKEMAKWYATKKIKGFDEKSAVKIDISTSEDLPEMTPEMRAAVVAFKAAKINQLKNQISKMGDTPEH